MVFDFRLENFLEWHQANQIFLNRLQAYGVLWAQIAEGKNYHYLRDANLIVSRLREREKDILCLQKDNNRGSPETKRSQV